MSNEESYRAIQRYLTNEREPYAPGTEGNAKRKIRKAAACYVVRAGTLYYQRRLRDRNRFAELEVVLQAARRRGLIEAAHVGPDGTHRTRLQTWHELSQKYWWRGILKQVKDYIKECNKCQVKFDRSRSLNDTAEILEELGIDAQSLEDNNETWEESSNSSPLLAPAPKPPLRNQPVAKHEVIYVDSKGIVQQSSTKHGQAVLNCLNQQRLSNQFCDVTLLIEGEEYKAHKAVLAANSEYFRELFIEKGAVSSHEAVVDLSGFCKASFLPLLEFAYTSVLTFDFRSMAEVAMLARHLFMSEVLEICEHVHKQMEAKRLTVCQKSNVRVVESSHNVLEEKEDKTGPAQDNGEASLSAAINSEVEAAAHVETGGEMAEQSDPALNVTADHSLSPQTVNSESIETEHLPEVLPSSAEVCATLVQAGSRSAEDITSNAQNENVSSQDATSKAAEDVLEASKRKRRRATKSQDLDEGLVPKTVVPEPRDTPVSGMYKSRLRQRTVVEGGYIRLHKGLEKKLQNRMAAPKSAVQQIAMKLVQRGKKMKQPKKEKEDAEAQHKCNECGMLFQRRYTLIMHNLKHEKTKDYKCPLCKKEFQYATSLRAHLVRHFRKIETPLMPLPAATTVKPGDLQEVKGRTKRQFICDICGSTLPKLYSLRLHLLKHTGVKPHACKICRKTFTHTHGLKMHMVLHEAQKQFKCHLCEKSFVTKRSLQEHLSIHTGESKYLCSICGSSFHRASGLSKHLKKHRPKPEVRGYQCSQCEKSFYEARDLRQHMNKHLGVKPFQCQYCGKCYSWKKDWYSHVKSHSVTEPYKCTVCGKEFFEKALFRRHVKKATHGKKGRAKQNLERVCEHCGRKFTQLREYRRHMNNHEGVKPFECLTCGVSWADARSLKRHVRTHTGERPYVCPVCNEAYIDARTLRKHMTRNHGDYVPCKIMLEKDTLQFHNQGTQVEHAVSILAAEIQEQEAEIVGEEIETVVVTGETLEAIEAVSTEESPSISTLSDQSIMQVVNYVLAQHQGQKLSEGAETIETVEVEVTQVSGTD
ncbi:zinc finger and BTB domain-containing protein 11 [Rhinatrema bivittatum]|uniref:zinc finger and BTB domain-containing protein 11 n=1 Tax=Rhinatrema bivittatum TaxID=194408 RepID=UPI0011260A4A|nr:zinc finger and BTB domain-containing protein 11 [Rhinatrema bivittatum]